jgi:hypothetical protein
MTALESAKLAMPLPGLMARLGLSEHAKKSARCPFHEDRNNSFSVFQTRTGQWAWNCFAGCGGGDAVAFLARVTNISNGGACRRFIEMASPGTAASTASRVSSPPRAHAESSGLPVPMSDSENERALAMAANLRDDPERCKRIAEERNWRPETIVELAHEPSLGWHDGKIAFLYESGVKLRWRQDAERIIRWAFGKPWLWRSGFLWGRSTIYITEGETDCISLIDAGLEEDGHTLAVAIPSASTFAEEWAQLFADKDVILTFDGDQAGEQATRRISPLLRPVVKSLKRLNWGGLQHAS